MVLDLKKSSKNLFKTLLIVFGASPLVQLYNWTKGATVILDASEKAIAGLLSQERHPVIQIWKKLS